MSMNDSKGLLFGDGWLAAKEMWSDGCQSWVPMRIAKEGRLRRLLIMGVMARPPSTAREPFCMLLIRCNVQETEEGILVDKSPLACPPQSERGRMRIHFVKSW